MASKRTQDYPNARVCSPSKAGAAHSQGWLRPQMFELHSLLDEDGKVRVEVVWQPAERPDGDRPLKTVLYSITQLAGEDRPSFIQRVDDFICRLGPSSD